jgi:DNA-binding transcriptional MerR regulator
MVTPGYRIKTVASLTGVPRNTLLAWERRYGFVAPDRSGNRYRLYSDADVALIREVKQLVDQGHAVSEAVGLVQARARPLDATTVSEPLDGAADRLFEALRVFDRATAEQLYASLVHASYDDLLDHVFSPLLHHVGDAWQRGELTIVQEHFASAFCRDHLVAMFLRLGSGPVNGPRAVCATLPDETHELGLLGVSIRLALQGWRVTHLGARVPEEQLRDFLAEHPPALVCVSVIVTKPKKELIAYARRVRRALPSSAVLAIGGAGLPENLEPDAVEGVRFCRTLDELAR